MKRKAPLKRNKPLRSRREEPKAAPTPTRLHSFGGGPRLPKRTIRKRRAPATRQEKAWMDRVARMGCIVCRHEGRLRAASLHHVRTGYGAAERASHYEVLPLCPDHHQNGGFGVAFHGGERTWMAKYGTEIALLHEVYQTAGATFDNLAEWRGKLPPWWPQYLDGTAFTTNAAVIFEEENEENLSA